MTTPAPDLPSPGAESDLTDRATALVNPASGLANDYLNVFNEIVMMIDLLPDMPDLADNIASWSPVSYCSYFSRSTLSGREEALRAYEHLDPTFRTSFDRCAADLSRAAGAVCASVLDIVGRADDESTAALARLCGDGATRLRERLDEITEMVNSGPATPNGSRIPTAA